MAMSRGDGRAAPHTGPEHGGGAAPGAPGDSAYLLARLGRSWTWLLGSAVTTLVPGVLVLVWPEATLHVLALVSNNPYGRAVDAARPGRRQRLDSGQLGVVCVRVGNTVEAARVVRGSRSESLVRLNAGEVVVEADADTLPVGIDGEHVVLPSPVVCRSAPGALRVRVPRRRPGAPRAGGATAD
ncbi:hypothetical protein ACPF8X_32530, partial [Streptomyces sp. G35A]